MTVLDEWVAPDFLGFDDERSATRLLERVDVLFECTHRSAADDGGISVSRDAVVLHRADERERIASADVLGWSMGARRQFTVLTLWTGHPALARRTTVLRRFASAVHAAMREVFGDERAA